jgi:uncharacterized protein YdaU (DUF1376 family)
MAEFPALTLWTDAYLADTGDLTDAEHGCYLLLLMIAWRRPDNALPGDMEQLQRLLAGTCRGMHGNHFRTIVPPLLKRFFVLGDDSKYRQKRLEKEREYVRKRSERNRESARKRWPERNKNSDLSDAPAFHPGPSPTPTPTPTPTPSNKDSQIGKNGRENGGAYSGKWSNPGNRIARFQQKLLPVLKEHGDACSWDTIEQAMYVDHPDHLHALRACQDAAKLLGKGWPHDWPQLRRGDG